MERSQARQTGVVDDGRLAGRGMDERPRALGPVAGRIDRRNRDLVDPLPGHDAGLEAPSAATFSVSPRNESTASGSVMPRMTTGVSRSTAASAGSAIAR